MRSARLVGATVVVLVGVGGCGSSGGGSSSSSASSSARSTASESSQTASKPTATTPALAVPPGSVALVAGAPITVARFHHWELVAAKSEAAQSPGQPVIVPTDPPGFVKCIAAVRKSTPSFAHRPATALRSICSQLFKTLSDQVLEFLITGDWSRDEAARQGLTPSSAQVEQTLDAQKRKQFPDDAKYRAFLRATGQTDTDIRDRVALQLDTSALLAHQTGSTAARQAAVERELKRSFLPQTLCAPLYVMSDCSNDAVGGP